MTIHREADEHAGNRGEPLIESVSIDPVVVASRDWAGEDERLTAARSAIDRNIERVRANLSAIGVRPSEQPGAPVNTWSVAMTTLEATQESLALAMKSWEDARKALAEARVGAEGAMQLVGDVKLARWVVGGLVVVFLILFIAVQFGG